MLKKIFYEATKWCLDLIFPKNCLGCQKEGNYLCPTCKKSIPINNTILCYGCGRRSPNGQLCLQCRKKHKFHLTGLLVASDWENQLLKQIVYEYKYRFIKDLANPLSEIMINFIKINASDELPFWSSAKIVIIPVPLHPKREIWRGFNQSTLLGKILAQQLKIDFKNNLLIRHRFTSPQADIKNQKNRQKNIKNAFSLKNNLSKTEISFLKNKIVILIDDIATTGATLNECALALKPLQPKEIWGLVLARG